MTGAPLETFTVESSATRYVTVRHGAASSAGLVRGSDVVLLAAPDAGAAVASAAAGVVIAEGPSVPFDSVELLPVVPRPSKVFCVGLNYAEHIREMGRELPGHPTLFAKFTEALIGPADDIVLPPESVQVDWEAELCVVIGSKVRRATPAQARAAIGGYTVLNDVTVRDWQYRTLQWLQGKTFESTTPVGPWIVPRDEVDVEGGVEIRCEVNGEVVQRASTDDLVFGPVALVEYISTIVTLHPGDLISTGTPAGVGHAMDPPRFLSDGDVVRTVIEGIGALENVARRES